MNYSKKSLPDLLKLATKHFNEYIRKRDLGWNNYFYCPSCKKMHKKEFDNYHACHLFDSNQNPHLKYDERNCFGGCREANFYKHSSNEESLKLFHEFVEMEIGEEEYKSLCDKQKEIKQISWKWDRSDLIDVIEKYKKKIKSL